jgi:glutamate synthase (NADPH/NADH) small chain
LDMELKLEKQLLTDAYWYWSRRNHFKTNVNVGVNYSIDQLNTFDSIVLCGGSTTSRTYPQKNWKQRSGSSNDLLTQQTKS